MLVAILSIVVFSLLYPLFMVFDTLKKSLSDFTDKVTSPIDTITEVTQSMKKKLIWPDTNLLALIENSLRYTPYTTGIKKTLHPTTYQDEKT